MPTKELLEAIKRLRMATTPPEPELPHPGIDPRLTQAEDLTQQAMPQRVAPQGIKENIVAGLMGAFHRGGYGGMMQNREAGERQRQQDLLARAQALRGESLQREQLGMQQRNAGLNEQRFGLDQQQFGFEQSKFGQQHELEQERLAQVKAYQNRPPVPEGYTLNPGDVRFEGNRQVASVPATTPSVQREPRDPRIGTTIETADGIMQWNPATQRYDIRAGASKPSGNATSATTTTSAYGDERTTRMLETAQKLKDQIDREGRWVVGGASDFLGMLPETQAKNFRTTLDSLKASISFSELTAMREASKTGGALGNVSNVELKLLENALAGLDTAQSPQQFKEQLDTIIKIGPRLQRAVAGQGGGAGGGAIELERGPDGKLRPKGSQ